MWPFDLFRKKPFKWPTFAAEDIRRRARILVVDDAGFPYLSLFKRDEYSVDSWRDVTDLAKLESMYYDLILLDIQGVGAKISADQGLGVLRHIKRKSPTQLVVAYSDADWSLRFKSFFDEADAVLPKAADYVDFKRAVDGLLQKRFSVEFYIDRAMGLLPSDEARHKYRAVLERAIRSGKTEDLRASLTKDHVDSPSVSTILQVTEVAIGVFQILVAG